MPKITSHNTDDSSLIPELLNFLKKSLKGVVEFFEQQLKNIKITDGLSLLNLLKPFGKFLGQVLLFFKFFRLFKDAVKLGSQLGKGCDLIYVPVAHPNARQFRSGSIDELPIKIPGSQAYILLGGQLFFVDQHEKKCIRWHITEEVKRASFSQQVQEWLRKHLEKTTEKAKKDKLKETTDEEIQTIKLSEKRLSIIERLTGHKRPGEIIKGLSKPLFGVIGGSSLFFKFINSALKMGLFIASIFVYNGVIPEAVSQMVSVVFFNISFVIIGINLVKTFSRYLNEINEEKRAFFRNKLFRETLELLLPLAVIGLAGLVWLGFATPVFSAFITVGFLGFPFFQNIFRGVDHFVEFQNVDAQRTRKALKKLLSLTGSAISVLTSGYVFAKALGGVIIEIGTHLFDLGQLAFNSAGFVFTAFTVVCCLVEFGQSAFMLGRNLKQLANEVLPFARKELYQEMVGYIFDMVFSSGILLIALLGFWGLMNPFVGVPVIASLFLGNLVINKFFPEWRMGISDWLFSDDYEVNSAEPMEIKGITLPNLPVYVKEVERLDSELGVSMHPSALYGSRIKGPLSPEGVANGFGISLDEKAEILSPPLGRALN